MCLVLITASVAIRTGQNQGKKAGDTLQWEDDFLVLPKSASTINSVILKHLLEVGLGCWYLLKMRRH